MLSKIQKIVLAFLIATALGAVHGQSYPSRPVRIIVPTNPGGAPDTIARLLAQKLNTHYNSSFIVENRAGAANLIGTDYVAKAAPDGYTLLLGTSIIFGIMPGLNPKMPFDPIRDFAPIMRFANVPHVIVASPSMPVNNIQEFVKYVAANPGKFSYGSSGQGSSHHLVMEALLHRAGGLKMIHVPFKGSQEGVQAILGGHIHFAVFAVQSANTQIRAGKVKVLGLANATRSTTMPEIVPISEQGYPGFNISNWMGLFAPAGTPKAVIDSIEAACMKIFKEREMIAEMEKMGFELAVMSSDQYAKQISIDIDTYGKVIKAANVKLDR